MDAITVVESVFGSFDKLKSVRRTKPAKVTLTTQVSESIIKTENVMGFLEGRGYAEGGQDTRRCMLRRKSLRLCDALVLRLWVSWH